MEHYRHMAEDCVNHSGDARPFARNLYDGALMCTVFTQRRAFGHLSVYGSDAQRFRSWPKRKRLAAKLDPAMLYIGAEVVWATRFEMARKWRTFSGAPHRALMLNGWQPSEWRTRGGVDGGGTGRDRECK